jgi:hypothetical protein
VSAYDPDFIKPSVQSACDHLIANGFEFKVFMRVNDDGTVTLIDYSTYVDSLLNSRDMA